jgi:hypothetical protein
VTLAFLALVGGLAGPAEGKEVQPSANASSFQWGDPIYLNFSGLPGDTKQTFIKLEYKLNQALGSLSRRISTSFYDKHKIDATFLKIDAANQEFLKIDAAANFLKIDGTAANANKLGGLTPDAFVQGHANVVSGEVTLNGDGKPQALMQTPDGAILIGLQVNPDTGDEYITVHNGTSAPITGVADPTAVEFSVSSGGDKQIFAGSTLPSTTAVPPTDGSLMTHIQIFPGQGLRDVITATVSSEPQTGGQVTAVGQMLIGLL